MKSLDEWLRVHPVFAGLAAAEKSRLVERSLRRELEKGEVVALQGDVWPYLFLVGKGQVEASKVSGQGRNLLIASFGPGDLFWGPAFFEQGAPLPATIEACCPTCLYVWSRPKIEPLLLANGPLSWELCRLMVQRMQRASTLVEGLAFHPVAGRLARFLLEITPEREGEAVPRSLTLDEIAARIGTTREVACRFLRRFADEELIDITRTDLIIKNRSSLEGLAEEVKG